MERFDGMMTESEMMSIVIFYHLSDMKCFKYYDEHCVQTFLFFIADGATGSILFQGRLVNPE